MAASNSCKIKRRSQQNHSSELQIFHIEKPQQKPLGSRIATLASTTHLYVLVGVVGGESAPISAHLQLYMHDHYYVRLGL
jgi:hypothetical protein